MGKQFELFGREIIMYDIISFMVLMLTSIWIILG